MTINAITIDVEDYFHVSAMAGSISRDQWDQLPSRLEVNNNKVLQLFERYDTRATFFILGWVAERFPEVVREIASQGHEVACHGYSHQLIYQQSREEFYAETFKAKEIIECITGVEVKGYRAASYSITNRSLWALDVLTDLGFEYDSSIVPVHHDLYGIPSAPRGPHTITAPNKKMIIEFPPTTLALPGLNLPIAGGGYFRLYPYWFSKGALNWVNWHDKMPFIFYLHPWELDPDQPRIKTSLKSRFRHYNNLDKCERRMQKLLQDFDFASAREVLANLNLVSGDLERVDNLQPMNS